ncbi:Aminomethyltransferase folate-binding domain-containing protein [Lentinula edodes]|uniref:Aminomethyltransferase folate-binding domain-containing protein n=1 Tax=Lentinula lateritia TaxID=40482 RepID=A0A9W9AF94_9AGAR|nr:Aminomethyltransferase folate-binding domain-containing protein [Lentinula edodes]
MALLKLPPAVRNILPTGPSVARLNFKSVLSVSGSQAPDFLHGILSSAVPTSNRPFFSAALNAQGRVLYDVLVFSDHSTNGRPAYLLEYDSHSSDAPSLHQLLQRYVLRAKVKIRDVSQEYDSWASWGSEKDVEWDTERDWLFAESGAIEPVWPPTTSEDWPWGSQKHIIRDRRAVGMGHRLLVRKGDPPSQTSDHDIVPQDAYNLHRILHGVPEGHIDIVPSVAFPMDSNLDVMGAVDFRKGCYIGQELTVRTYHKGVVRKRTVPVLIQSSSRHKSTETEDIQEKFGTNIDIKPANIIEGSGPRPRGTGKLLSNSHGIGLALLRTEHVDGVASGDLKLDFTSESGATWSVTPWWPEWWPKRLL